MSPSQHPLSTAGPPSLSIPLLGPAAHADAAVRAKVTGRECSPKPHLTKVEDPTPGNGFGPPRERGASPATELQGRRHRYLYGPHSRYRPAPEASTLLPLGAAARLLLHPHPRSLWPSASVSLAPGSTRRGRIHTANSTTLTPGPSQLPSVCKLLQ